MEEILIRNATPRDLDEVTALEAACFSEADAASRERLAERLGAFKTTFIVAEINGKMVGMIDGCVTTLRKLEDRLYASTELHDEAAPNVMLFGVAVLAEYRGRGIASKMMNWIIGDSRRRGRKLISLTCKDRYIGFYERFGYVNEGASTSTHGGAKWNDMTLFLKKSA